MENGPMVSEVSICNKALGWLGAKRISSLSENSVPAMLCRDNYEPIRDAVLESRMWTFATARAISEVGDDDLDEFERMYLHSIPQGWLGVYRCYRRVDPKVTKQKSRNWRREGNKILTEDPKVYMWGVQRITDTGKFTSLFVEALTARLAAELCVSLTENRQREVDLWGLYDAKLREAAARDGQQGESDDMDVGSFIKSRASHLIGARL